MKNKFVKRKLKRINLELQELLGMLSIEELTTNWRFINHYQDLHQKCIRI
jgi:hypothetical protein